MSALGAASRDARLMPPPPPRRAPTVLQEDEWTLLLEEIIERDFFPDLAALRSRLEWLQASRGGDPEAVREAQLRMQARAQRGTPWGEAAGTPSFGTPTWSAASTPARGEQAQPPLPLPSDLRLDAFLSRYTSEDNAAFEALLSRANARRAQSALPASARAQEEAAGVQRRALLALDSAADASGEGAAEARAQAAAARAALLTASPIDGAGGSGQRISGLLPPPQPARNSLFFVPAGAGAAPDARRGALSAANTRFRAAQAGGAGEPAEPAAAAAYSRLATPLPSPGASPFMTWGRAEATPVRLDPPEAGGGAARFRIAPPPPRDLLALQLGAGAAARRGAARSREATPARAARGTPRAAAPPGLLSEAALRLLRCQRAPGLGGDAELRRSYGGTPRATPAASPAATPAKRARGEGDGAH